MNRELWERAAEYHGHECAGLALGVRLGEEARRIFGPKAVIHCKMDKRTCITDGITVALGAEEEEDRIEIDSSVSEYIFYELGEEEGWSFRINPIDFSKMEDAVAVILSCGRDFLFRITPCDMD